MLSFYCERVSDDFFGEPFNAFTNIFFIFSSILIIRLSRDYISFFSVSFIGLASFLFHTYPSSLTGFLDVLAIIIFMLLVTNKIYLQFFNLRFLYSIFISIFFVIICYICGMLLHESILGTSSFYFPIILHLFFLIIYLHKKKFTFENLKYLYYSTLLFSCSILFRILDKKVCVFFPVGTHFIWHIFNAIFLYLLIKFLYLSSHRATPKKPPQSYSK
ncbi:MAG: hypothetical protein CFH34_01147 [Alphaproteobacteria bacterium MarineAlpha9_Bin4]|nr:hypothetical protein [Pelagibacterales bacterium]PPR26069.1 MAG: hypothetical protein CFH34_01147 [Alphaproteobacteria bacterium MarineAlpha9_Bin4]